MVRKGGKYEHYFNCRKNRNKSYEKIQKMTFLVHTILKNNMVEIRKLERKLGDTNDK